MNSDTLSAQCFLCCALPWEEHTTYNRVAKPGRSCPWQRTMHWRCTSNRAK
jgi:hypothetical protein